jgi:hypothetical protein
LRALWAHQHLAAHAEVREHRVTAGQFDPEVLPAPAHRVDPLPAQPALEVA